MRRPKITLSSSLPITRTDLLKEFLVDFDQAIQCHVEWKMKLTSYIRKPDRSLDPSKVCGDAGCPLGKWLKGEGAKFSSTPEYAQLVADHARFHQAARANTQESPARSSPPS